MLASIGQQSYLTQPKPGKQPRNPRKRLAAIRISGAVDGWFLDAAFRTVNAIGKVFSAGGGWRGLAGRYPLCFSPELRDRRR